MDSVPPELLRLVSTMGLSASDMQNLMPDIGPQLLSQSTQSDELDVVAEIESARERWKTEAQMPEDRPALSSRRVLEMSTEQQLQQAAQSKGDTMSFWTYRSYIGNEMNFSVTPIEELAPVTLREMHLRKVYKSKYLLCRTFTRGVRKVATELGVEDSNGDCILVSLYNMPHLFQATQQFIDAYFPPGTIFAIREPWMKTASTGTSNPMIRVDSPSDVIVVSESDSLARPAEWRTKISQSPTTTALQWKEVGNKYFKQGFYVPAVLAWSRGLKKDPTMHAFRLNRAQGFLKLEWFSAALSDSLQCVECLSDAALQRKAQYRAACAEYGLSSYTQALKRFEALPNHASDTHDWIGRCQKRIAEGRTAQYSFLDMFRDSQKENPHLDVADYISAALKIAQVPSRGGGRGVFAKRAINTGELLVVARPFAFVYPAELLQNELTTGLNFLTKRMSKTTTLALTAQVISKVLGCPEQKPLIEALYAGSKYPSLPTEYPPSSSTNEPTHVDPLIWADIDITRIDGVISYNTFGPMPVTPVTQENLMSARQDDIQTASALYTYPSLFNHSCDANASWKCYGDVMVIRAAQTISSGQEVTLAYASGRSYMDRGKQLDGIIEEPCDCMMCTEERTGGKLACQKRQRLHDELEAEQRARMQRSETTILAPERTKQYLQQILATYRGKSVVPSSTLLHAYFLDMQSNENAAGRLHREDLLRYSIKQGWCVLETAGFIGVDKGMRAKSDLRYTLPISKNRLAGGWVDIDVCILLIIHISASFLGVDDKIPAERWFRAAWWAHESAFGGGQALFNARIGGFLDKTKTPRPGNLDYRWK